MMKKLHLDLDALSVESFATAEGEKERGTVHGHVSAASVCVASGCNTYCSCYESCIQGVCGSEFNTFNESCVAGACPNSYDQLCESRNGHGCYEPLTL